MGHKTKDFLLGTYMHLAEIPNWTKRHRAINDLKKVPFKNSSKFGTKVRSWWISLQPIFRGGSWPLVCHSEEGEKWADLRKCGKNGFVLILVVLNWWIRGASTVSEKNEVMSMMEDVVFALGEIVKVGGGGKRKADEELTGDAKRWESYPLTLANRR